MEIMKKRNNTHSINMEWATPDHLLSMKSDNFYGNYEKRRNTHSINME
jgi:hypothetical protein